MAVAYVRDTGLVEGNNVDSWALSFGTLPVVGNHVFALSNLWKTGNSSGIYTGAFSDNQGNTWATDIQGSQPSGGAAAAAIGSAKVATSAGTFTVTIDPAGFGIQSSGLIVEFSGLALSSHLDQTGKTEQLSGGTNTVTATGANSQANMLVLSICGLNSSGTSPSFSNPPSGYVNPDLYDNELSSGGGELGAAAYKIITGSETSSCVWTQNQTTRTTVGLIATYKSATGGGGGGSAFPHHYYQRLRSRQQFVKRGGSYVSNHYAKVA